MFTNIAMILHNYVTEILVYGSVTHLDAICQTGKGKHIIHTLIHTYMYTLIWFTGQIQKKF